MVVGSLLLPTQTPAPCGYSSITMLFKAQPETFSCAKSSKPKRLLGAVRLTRGGPTSDTTGEAY